MDGTESHQQQLECGNLCTADYNITLVNVNSFGGSEAERLLEKKKKKGISYN